MQVRILAFGIARDILGGSQMTMELPKQASVGQLKEKLCDQYPDFQKLASLSIAVNTAYAEDNQLVQPEDELVIIPPVSGG
jgi:molybdopterin converting factor subunit 1